MTFNVIGDIAGRFDTFQALIKKMPEAKFISVGDIVDRGPKSKEMVEWFMDNQEKAEVLMGNHEHMLVDFCRNTDVYEKTLWFMNGGMKTFEQYGMKVPENVVKFLETRKYKKELEIDGKKVLISHSFLPRDLDTKHKTEDDKNFEFIWNRHEPNVKNEYHIQIAGHNSQFGFREWNRDGKIAYCIDSSREGVLTGIHLPTMKIYTQEFLE